MSSIFGDTLNIFFKLFTFDAWEISQALQTNGVWLFGAIIAIGGGLAFLLVYKMVPWMKKYFETTIMVSTYLLMGGIIAVEVVRRFFFGVQSPWSTTLPPMLFLIMTWFSCAYNVKLRSHLSFQEFRTKMPRVMQFSCLVMDALLWIIFSWIVVTTSLRIITNSASNFQILLGTDNIMQWWFMISVPLAFMLIIARSFENIISDYHKYKSGDALIVQVAIGEG